jgi:sn-glycerol 3-phosphate transport system substrate-binding protein
LLKEGGTEVDLTSEEMYEAVKFIRDLVYVHKIMPHNWTGYEGGEAFLRGKVAMGPFISSGLVFMETNLPWELKISTFPTFRGKRWVPLTGLALVNFAHNKKKRTAANDFIMWLVNKENTIKIYKEVGYLPVRKSAVQSMDLKAFIKDNPNYTFPLDALEYCRPLPNHREYYKINLIIKEMLAKIILTDADIRTELAATEDKINEAIKE